MQEKEMKNFLSIWNCTHWLYPDPPCEHISWANPANFENNMRAAVNLIRFQLLAS